MQNLFLVDSNPYLYKSYYSFADKSNSKGSSISAVYGFTHFLLKLIDSNHPNYLAVVFENKNPMMPPDLKAQIPHIRRILSALKISQFQMQEYKSNDALATIASNVSSPQIKVYIISSDKAILQVVDENINIINPNQDGRIFNKEAVKTQLGAPPELIPDLLALMGDESDNIAGIPGVGKKTAILLLEKFGSLENILANIDKIHSVRLKDVITRYYKRASFNKKIAAVNKNLPLEFDLEKLRLKEFDTKKLEDLLREYELLDLLSAVSTHKSPQTATYIKVVKESQLKALVDNLKKQKEFAVDTETTSVEPMKAEIVGTSISFEPNKAFYIPIGHKGKGAQEQLDKQLILDYLRPVLENEQIKKIGQNIKYEKIIFNNAGVKLRGINFDTMIASYLINPQRGTHNLADLALKYLNYKMIETKDLIGAHKDMSEVDTDKVTEYACEDADITLKLKNIFSPIIEREGPRELFETVEMPLVEVLSDMEIAGVKINKEYLQELSFQLQDKIDEVTKEAYSLAGQVFNINSPQQLSLVLFEKLKLPPTKKTHFGFTTTLEALEKLKEKHQIIKAIIQYKMLSSAKSSHIDPLLELVNANTGKIHTSFHQTATQTGRLSSSSPNLQNVPIRQQLGAYIRKAFIAEEGNTLLSCDYSQIELRILAHFSKDEFLLKAFAQGRDIHAQTASAIFNVALENVTQEMRNKAKVVNFGIIYGMSPMGLAKELNISESEAASYINSYFDKHADVKKFIQNTLSFAQKTGYVKTLMGRKRFLPGINSLTRNIRESSKREAINTPIQGSAADIIKLAMVKIHKKFQENNLISKLILQIHDELVFEINLKEIQEAKNIIKGCMENAYPLLVRLEIKTGEGKNWLQAHA